MNAAYDPSGAIKYNADINVAMAVALDGGLITPTLKQANKMNLVALGGKWRELVKKAQEKRLTPDEYTTGKKKARHIIFVCVCVGHCRR